MKTILFFLSFIPLTCLSQFNEIWNKTYNGDGDYTDHLTCLTTDNAGNIYAGGYTQITDENADFLVVKYSNTGQLLWKKSWRGSGQGPDIAYAIAYANNTIYATGEVSNYGLGFDFFTIAVSTSGDSIWGAHYNDAAYNQYDQANALAIDSNGNIIVSGQSDRDPSSIINDDFLTIKYNSNGQMQWTKRYNGTANAIDRSVAVAVDGGGNIIAAGRSSNGFDDDYAVIKYDGAGNVLWSDMYDNGGTDRITDMGLDNSGSIYVTGRSSNGNDDDFRTLKYASSGQQVFNVAYDFVEDDRADFIDVNPDGTFAVAGRSDASAAALINYNYRVIKYSADGAQLWSNSFEGTGANDDIVQDVDITTTGEVLVTGYSDALATAAIQNDVVSILYNTSGNAVWTKTFNGSSSRNDEGDACLLDAQGNAWIAGHSENSSSQRDAILLGYSSAGNQIAATLWNGIGDNSDNLREIITDNSGNIYVAGYSVGKDTDRDMFLCKLSSAGDTLWTRQVTGTLFGSDEEANAIALDNTGNVIISGYTKNSGTGSDITISKYSSAGVLAWTVIYNSPSNESDRSYDLTTDAQGNIYITGKSDINSSPIITNDEIFTAKYNAAGTLQWSALHTGGSGIDRGRSIHVATSGNVYVCAQTFNGTDDDISVIKYNSSGTQQWIYTHASSDMEIFKNSILRSGENITLCANSAASTDLTATRMLILNIDNTGSETWTQGNSSNLATSADALAQNSSGEILMVGSIATQAGPQYNFDCLTMKFQADGQLIWENQYNSPAGLDDIGDVIAVDANDNVIVACHSNTGTITDINYHLVLLALNGANGSFANSAVFAASDSINVCNDIVLSNNQIIVGGSLWSNANQRDILVVKYELAVGLEEIATHDFSIYPNPSLANVTVALADGASSGTILLHDQFGRLLETWAMTGKNSTFNITHLPSGTYTISAITREHTIRKNFIKL